MFIKFIFIISYLIILAGCQNFKSESENATTRTIFSTLLWSVKAYWRIEGNDIPYSGTGATREIALENAKQACINGQVIPDWKNYCRNQPTRVEANQSENCGIQWTPYVGWGSEPGDPCAQYGCRRGDEVDTKVQIGRTSHGFQCWRDPK